CIGWAEVAPSVRSRERDCADAGDRGRVRDLAGQRTTYRLIERDARHRKGDFLMLRREALRHIGQPAGEEHPDRFIGHARRVVDINEDAPVSGSETRLLEQLTARSVEGRLSGHVEQPGRQLVEVAANRMAVLVDKDDPVLLIKRYHAYCAGML